MFWKTGLLCLLAIWSCGPSPPELKADVVLKEMRENARRTDATVAYLNAVPDVIDKTIAAAEDSLGRKLSPKELVLYLVTFQTLNNEVVAFRPPPESFKNGPQQEAWENSWTAMKFWFGKDFKKPKPRRKFLP